MHIEFKLPTGAGGQAALHYYKRISERIELWLAKNMITDYDIRTSVNNSYVLAFTLSRQEQYTLFLLAWNEPTLPVPKLITL